MKSLSIIFYRQILKTTAFRLRRAEKHARQNYQASRLVARGVEKFSRQAQIWRQFGKNLVQKANSLTMILLNIAADKELRATGKTKITRKMTADYIPALI